IICWEIWKARCSNKFDAINPYVYKTKANILFTIVQITKKKFGKANIVESWRNIHYILDAEIHYRTTTIVKWIKPPNMSVKLNSDGSCIQDRCGGGCLIRNSLGTSCLLTASTWDLIQATSQKWLLFFMALNGVLIEASLKSGLKQTPCC
ncbi:hypothetical protein MTR67_034853, partial [Solanum verrucosum]